MGLTWTDPVRHVASQTESSCLLMECDTVTLSAGFERLEKDVASPDRWCDVWMTASPYTLLIGAQASNDICLPYHTEMSLAMVWYRIGQLYMISKHSHEQSDRGEGVEVVQNEPYEDPAHGQGQFTEKRVYLNSRIARQSQCDTSVYISQPPRTATQELASATAESREKFSSSRL
ncbi:hypothetical protein SKAU_G00123790 [Synaphobranchus kaupii]|uniref:Phosphatidylinositol transfer protein N-terminal domain-containing protein n=1 Tax=Synaphobranchus kaupii TaxID=118154 RepID=A0A9Q1FPW8_SYNKA|nr:hypothetical protein SKAU_G00123790 [Synaphobranchus kaupii]